MTNNWVFRVDFQDHANIPVVGVARRELDAAIQEVRASGGEILAPHMVEYHPTLKEIFRGDPALYVRIEGERGKPFSALHILMQRTRAMTPGRPKAYMSLP